MTGRIDDCRVQASSETQTNGSTGFAHTDTLASCTREGVLASMTRAEWPERPMISPENTGRKTIPRVALFVDMAVAFD
jgi:hypothetical protein